MQSWARVRRQGCCVSCPPDLSWASARYLWLSCGKPLLQASCFWGGLQLEIFWPTWGFLAFLLNGGWIPTC